jgi:sugar phosphate isomerase/epimerase
LAVELVLTPDTRWPVDVDDLVAMTAAAGFSGLGMTGAWITTVFVAGIDARRLELVSRCAAIFADAGVGMAVEFSPAGAVTSITEGLAIVDAVGADRAALLVDSWHFHVGPSTWGDLERLRPEQLASVQFSDVQAPLSDDVMAETMERRVMPGDGLADLDRFATTLLEGGFDGLVSVEVLNRELRRLRYPNSSGAPTNPPPATGPDSRARARCRPMRR